MALFGSVVQEQHLRTKLPEPYQNTVSITLPSTYL